VSPDPQALLQGLSISISGILITFLALGVFIFVMFGLQRLFPPKPEEEEEAKSEAEAAVEPVEQDEVSEEAEIAVAIATAIQYFRSKSGTSLGKSLEAGHGPLWYSHSSSITRSHRS
jgi:sodium pump decarboxylase gamma subunit